jgi:L-asparaginase II
LVLEASILAETHRGGLTENRHWGWITLADSDGSCLYSTPGSESIGIFLRSSAKPFQAMPLVRAGLHRELSGEELAIACASHVASRYHLQVVEGLLQKAGLSPEHLQCGPHPPIDAETAQQLLCAGREPTPLHNNCSGKHAAMLFYCTRRNLGLDYLDTAHPLQQEIGQIIRAWSGLESPAETAVDGCGTPTYHLPLLRAARLYARLGEDPEAAPIVNAMTTYPEAMSGAGRVDAAVMKASGGKIVSKIGADGVSCISRVGVGQGLAFKIADGQNEIRNLLIPHLLHRLGWLDDEAWHHPELAPFRDLSRKNTQNKVIGAVRILVG